jgi:hypothetical protein
MEMFYLSTGAVVLGLQTSELELCRWTGSALQPFEPDILEVATVAHR